MNEHLELQGTVQQLFTDRSGHVIGKLVSALEDDSYQLCDFGKSPLVGKPIEEGASVCLWGSVSWTGKEFRKKVLVVETWEILDDRPLDEAFAEIGRQCSFPDDFADSIMRERREL